MLINTSYEDTAFTNNQCKQNQTLIATEVDVDRFGEHVQQRDNDLTRSS